MKKFAVIAQPIKHSLSPRIHSEFAKEAGIEISYEAIEMGPENFEQEIIKVRFIKKDGYSQEWKDKIENQESLITFAIFIGFRCGVLRSIRFEESFRTSIGTSKSDKYRESYR